jgi:hypothetical protein
MSLGDIVASPMSLAEHNLPQDGLDAVTLFNIFAFVENFF